MENMEKVSLSTDGWIKITDESSLPEPYMPVIVKFQNGLAGVDYVNLPINMECPFQHYTATHWCDARLPKSLTCSIELTPNDLEQLKESGEVKKGYLITGESFITSNEVYMKLDVDSGINTIQWTNSKSEAYAFKSEENAKRFLDEELCIGKDTHGLGKKPLRVIEVGMFDC